MIKFRYATKAEIPQGLEGFYEERDGAWVLKVEGAVAREKLDEFRDKNVTLLKENEELKKKFEGIDPEEARKLGDIKRELEDKKLKEKDLEKVLEDRVAAVRKDYEAKLTKATADITTRDTELARLRISDAATAEAMKLGLRPSAKDDLIARASQTFKLVDGKVVALENGDPAKVRYNAHGDPFSIKDFVESLAKETAPHLFEASNGTGATGGGAGHGQGAGGFNGKNPWARDSFNLTEQGRLYKQDPKLAAKLATEAGHSVPAVV